MGKSGFHCMLADSTNAHKEGKCPSEDDVFDSILEVINDARAIHYSLPLPPIIGAYTLCLEPLKQPVRL